MTEKAVADFVGRYVVDPAAGSDREPRDGRVVMSDRRIVVASDEGRLTVPLAGVVDVVVGNVPTGLPDLFDDTVTIAYESDGGVRTVLIEAGSETVTRFVDVLFKCLLNGTEAIAKHPEKVGGRMMDAEATPAKVSIDSKRVLVATPDEDFEIDTESVVDFDRTERAPAGDDRPTLVVVHADGDEVVTSLLAPNSGRKVTLLGRYLRIEYNQVRQSVQGVELGDSETRVLVSVYAAGGDIDFAEVLDGGAAQATDALASLREEGLVDGDGTDVALTARGRVVVTQRFDDVDV